MAYQVIARKYRPQRFADVVGQEHVTTTLANAIQANRIAHAYLFCGPRGTGKTTVARIFAKCLNCTDGPRVDFALDDPRCVEIAEGRSLDVFEIDGASNRGIEEIRQLRETVKYAPASSKFKIYIIDEVHMLTKEAFNALLKTLEEPPAHVKFLFATTEPEKVLATILSRCQRFDLRRIPAALIAQHLDQIARQEQVEIGEAARFAIARGADGGMRDAESALDQLISFCGERIEESDVLSMFGLASAGQVQDLFHRLLEDDTEGALRRLDELCRHGKDLGRLLSDLLARCRNLLLFQVCRGDLSLLQVSEAEAAALNDEARRVTVPELTRMMESLADHEGRLRDTTSKRILVEVALFKAIEARRAVALDDVLQRLQSLRSAGEAAPVPAAPAARTGVARAPAAAPAPAQRTPTPPLPSPAPAPEPAPAPAAVAAVPGGAPDTAILWPQLLEAVGRTSPFVRSYLMTAYPVGFERGTLTIGFPPDAAAHLELMNSERNRQLLQARLADLGHPGSQIRLVVSSAGAPAGPAVVAPPAPSADPKPPGTAPAPAAATYDPEDFKNDPLIQKALEVFKGRIVDVRT